MNELLAPEFFEFGRSGRIWTRSETLDAEPQVIRARLPLSKFAVHMVVPDVVLVTYRSEGLGDDVEVGNRASLWRKGANRWQLVFHQGTPTSR